MPRVSIPVTAPNRAGVAQPAQTRAPRRQNASAAAREPHSTIVFRLLRINPLTIRTAHRNLRKNQ